MRIFILILSFAISSYAQVISWQHEEDKYDNCDLKKVSYSDQDAHGLTSDEFGEINFVFNKRGTFVGAFTAHSKTCEPKGFMISGSIDKDNLAAAVVASRTKKTFTFNDAYQDLMKAPLPIDDSVGILVPIHLDLSGVNDPANHGIRARYAYAKKESRAAMDYRMILPPSASLFLIDGVAYNNYDAGNYIWGAGMRRLGFSAAEVKMGSELNGVVNTRFENDQGRGIIIKGDSKKDQRAIKRGFNSEFAKVDPKDYLNQFQTRAMMIQEYYDGLLRMVREHNEYQKNVNCLTTLLISDRANLQSREEVIKGIILLCWKKYSAEEKEKLIATVRALKIPELTKIIAEVSGI